MTTDVTVPATWRVTRRRRSREVIVLAPRRHRPMRRGLFPFAAMEQATRPKQDRLPVWPANAAPWSCMPSRRTVVERTASPKGPPMTAPTATPIDLNDRADLSLIKRSDGHCLTGRREG
jgi:hypothetical protein